MAGLPKQVVVLPKLGQKAKVLGQILSHHSLNLTDVISYSGAGVP